MKKFSLLLISFAILFGCSKKEERLTEEPKNNTLEEQKKEVELPKKEEPVKIDEYKIPIFIFENSTYISVVEFSEALGFNYEFDRVNKTLSLPLLGANYSFIYGVPVYQKGIEFFPSERNNFLVLNETPYLSVEFFKNHLDFSTIEDEDNQQLVITFPENKADIPISSQPNKPTTVEEVTSILSILSNPIENAKVSTYDSHLPGALRSYRNGVHEGMDFYGFTSGVTINRDTAILAMGEGTVVRADHDFVPYPSEDARNDDLLLSSIENITPEFILDRLRGRQVWVYYPSGILARFSHLNSIPATVKVGETVTKNTVIGYVGNSGTSGEVKNDDSELHLHLDILINGELFWKGLTPEEVRDVLLNVFEKNDRQ